jgi:osmotically-inducible protein OsmY
MKRFRRIFLTAGFVLVPLASALAQTQFSGPEFSNALVQKKIRKALVTLPYYGVFDNLEYQLKGSTVILSGQVVRPTTKSDAARRVAKIEGVTEVVNNIEVLPLSSFDDSIRLRTYRAIYRTGSLYRYSLGTNPSIHIIVNRGNVTLEGSVANEQDKRLAYLVANSVSGVFSVTNNLRSETSLPQ